MPFAATCSRVAETAAALEQAVSSIRETLGSDPVDLAVLFVSEHHSGLETLAADLQQALGVKHLLGCTAETVICGDREFESGPALSLWCARLPGVPLRSFHVEFERTPDGLVASGLPMSDELTFRPGGVLLLGDPFSCATDAIIEMLGDEFPGLPLMGGMSSGGRGPGSNTLYLDGASTSRGAVGVFVGPGVEIRSIVSQGCRPVGQPFLVTRAQRNVVLELGGRTALEQLGSVFTTLEERDQKLLQQGPHLGIAMNEYQAEFRRGDFLISNVLGGDRSNGAIAIGHAVRVGQTVQFHVRDADTADEDLRTLLGRALEGAPAPEAGLLFSCNGRGTHMFPVPDHDAGVVTELAGPLPLAGLFAQGELGPVGGKNHIHGFTASLALFRSSDGAPQAAP